jgi:hypothetical protein
VQLNTIPAQSNSDLSFIVKHDTDAYNRWHASQQLFLSALLNAARVKAGDINHQCDADDNTMNLVAESVKAVLAKAKVDKNYHLAAVLLTLPSIGELCQAMPLPVMNIHKHSSIIMYTYIYIRINEIPLVIHMVLICITC